MPEPLTSPEFILKLAERLEENQVIASSLNPENEHKDDLPQLDVAIKIESHRLFHEALKFNSASRQECDTRCTTYFRRTSLLLHPDKTLGDDSPKIYRKLSDAIGKNRVYQAFVSGYENRASRVNSKGSQGVVVRGSREYWAKMYDLYSSNAEESTGLRKQELLARAQLAKDSEELARKLDPNQMRYALIGANLGLYIPLWVVLANPVGVAAYASIVVSNAAKITLRNSNNKQINKLYPYLETFADNSMHILIIIESYLISAQYQLVQLPLPLAKTALKYTQQITSDIGAYFYDNSPSSSAGPSTASLRLTYISSGSFKKDWLKEIARKIELYCQKTNCQWGASYRTGSIKVKLLKNFIIDLYQLEADSNHNDTELKEQVVILLDTLSKNNVFDKGSNAHSLLTQIREKVQPEPSVIRRFDGAPNVIDEYMRLKK